MRTLKVPKTALEGNVARKRPATLHIVCRSADCSVVVISKRQSYLRRRKPHEVFSNLLRSRGALGGARACVISERLRPDSQGIMPVTYTPSPIETSAVALSDDQRALVEKLAENAHDVWAKKRMDDGWTHGPARDDDAKHHPCLVPYDALPDSEKAYDREMVEQTIKAVLALGYQIDLPR